MKQLFYFAPRSIICSLGILCLSVAGAKAIIIGSSVDNGNGTYTYSYTVDNSAGIFDTIAFSLEFNFLSSFIDWNQLDVASGGGVTVPDANWIAQAGIPSIGNSSQDFFSLDPASDVLAGNSLSGFSFISALAPGSITYFFEFGALGESASGITVGPVALDDTNNVPDSGSSLALVLISLGFLAGGRRLFQLSSRLRAT